MPSTYAKIRNKLFLVLTLGSVALTPALAAAAGGVPKPVPTPTEKYQDIWDFLVRELKTTTLTAGEEHTKDSVDAVKQALAGKKAVLIDVREKQEWDKGHLRDAQLLPLSRIKEELSAKELQLLPKDKAIYLHCASGVRCVRAAAILRKKGYDVRPLKEGYKDLLKQGLPKAVE